MSRQGETRERTFGNVKEFWESEAHTWGEDPRVTIRDHFYRLLGVNYIVDFLSAEQSKRPFRILDVGCGTGFSTLHYAQVCKEIYGVDYSEGMISHAQEFLIDSKNRREVIRKYCDGIWDLPCGNIVFHVGDALDLKFSDGFFDVVISDRLLVNMQTPEMQDRVLVELGRVLKPGGLLFVNEATVQGHARIDSFRVKFGLDTMEKYWHNCYLNEDLLCSQLYFHVRDVQRFDVYQFLSKIVYTLTIRPEEPDFLSHFNRAAYYLARVYPSRDELLCNLCSHKNFFVPIFFEVYFLVIYLLTLVLNFMERFYLKMILSGPRIFPAVATRRSLYWRSGHDSFC